MKDDAMYDLYDLPVSARAVPARRAPMRASVSGLWQNTVEAFVAWRLRTRTMQSLAGLSAHTLRDIGFTPDDVEGQVRAIVARQMQAGRDQHQDNPARTGIESTGPDMGHSETGPTSPANDHHTIAA